MEPPSTRTTPATKQATAPVIPNGCKAFFHWTNRQTPLAIGETWSRRPARFRSKENPSLNHPTGEVDTTGVPS